MERNTYEIQNVEQLSEMKFDSAYEEPLYRGSEQVEVPGWKAIMNTSLKEPAQIASKNYQIIQHNDVATALQQTLKKSGLDIHGRIDDMHNQLKMDLIFGSRKAPIKDDSKQGIMLGIRVLNSYNKSTAFRLEMFAFRLICKNGMSLGKAMNQVKEVVFHTGKEKNLEMIQNITEKFIQDVVDSSGLLQDKVNDCLKDKMHWEQVTEICRKLSFSKKHFEEIMKKLNVSVIEVTDVKTGKKSWSYVLEKGGNEMISRWELYNAFTNHATHSGMGFHAENVFQDSAQRILAKPYAMLVKIKDKSYKRKDAKPKQA